MNHRNGSYAQSAISDLTAGLVVFLVALPLCLGVALASNAPLISGLLAGVVGGILVGAISKSQTSVSGPDAALAAIVATQIATLGFPAFLTAVVIAGLIQSAFGIARAGFVADFIPSSVVKGLLAAIGLLLIMKQLPHLLGHDADLQGNMAFRQSDDANTFTELIRMFDHIHLGATVVGAASIGILLLWPRVRFLKRSGLPAQLVVVMCGVGLVTLFKNLGGWWTIDASSLVQIPAPDGVAGVFGLLQWPDFTQWSNPDVWAGGLTIASAASLATLINIEAVDKIDPQQRTSPPSRELLAQGIGNVTSGLLGGIPLTSVIVRSSVNIDAGGRTKLATIAHGGFLFFSVMLLPHWLNRIPLSCLAAILLISGSKLASPKVVREMWISGRNQFVPFAATVIAIVFSDLLTGILIGLIVSIGFILYSNFRRPIRRVVEKHLGRDVLHIELANQVSFLNRAALHKVLDDVPRGGSVLLDAQSTDYIDSDVLTLLRDFTEQTAPARNVSVSMRGFQKKYQFDDRIQYVDFSTRELQAEATPAQVLKILEDGHERFRTGNRLTRDLGRQVAALSSGQHPLAVVLSCIDSRVPAELIFDVGLGDIFSIRIAGNIITREVLGSMEFACAKAGAKLVLIMGHTRCGAVAAAVESSASSCTRLAGWEHLEPIVQSIQHSIDPIDFQQWAKLSDSEIEAIRDAITHRNVALMTASIVQESRILRSLSEQGQIAVVGAVYDVVTGAIEFLVPEASVGKIENAPTVQTDLDRCGYSYRSGDPA